MHSLKSFWKQLSPTRRKAMRNVYWGFWGKIASLLSGLLIGILVVRYLGKDQYGLMSYVVSLVLLFQTFARFGLDEIEIRELASNRTPKDILLGTVFCIRTFLAVLTFAAVILFSFTFETDSLTRAMIALYALTILLDCFGVIRHYFTAIVQNEYVVKVEIARLVLSAILKIILLWIQAPLIWFIFALVVDATMLANGYLMAYRKKAGSVFHWKYNHGVAKTLLKNSFPLLLSGVAVIIYQRIDQVMLKNMLDNSAVGYFAAAARFTDIILYMPAILIQTLMPILIAKKESSEKIYKIQRQQFVSVIVWITILSAAGMSLFAHYIILWSFGSQMLPAVPVLQIMAFKAVGMALSSTSGQIIIAEKKQFWVFFRNLAACIVCVLFNWWAIPRYGIAGSAWATIITVMVGGWLSNLLIPQYHGIFLVQLRAIFLGWWDMILYVKSLMKEMRKS